MPAGRVTAPDKNRGSEEASMVREVSRSLKSTLNLTTGLTRDNKMDRKFIELLWPLKLVRLRRDERAIFSVDALTAVGTSIDTNLSAANR